MSTLRRGPRRSGGAGHTLHLAWHAAASSARARLQVGGVRGCCASKGKRPTMHRGACSEQRCERGAHAWAAWRRSRTARSGAACRRPGRGRRPCGAAGRRATCSRARARRPARGRRPRGLAARRRARGLRPRRPAAADGSAARTCRRPCAQRCRSACARAVRALLRAPGARGRACTACCARTAPFALPQTA